MVVGENVYHEFRRMPYEWHLTYLLVTGLLEFLPLIGVDRVSGGMYQNQHNNGDGDALFCGI
jgi:hypothetical protein